MEARRKRSLSSNLTRYYAIYAILSRSIQSTNDEGRISYTFVDTGVMDETGEPQLDLLPNPRHSLIEWIEKESHR